MRKVTVEVKATLTLNIDDGIEVSDVVDSLEIELAEDCTEATLEDFQIMEHEVKDSR